MCIYIYIERERYILYIYIYIYIHVYVLHIYIYIYILFARAAPTQGGNMTVTLLNFCRCLWLFSTGYSADAPRGEFPSST